LRQLSILFDVFSRAGGERLASEKSRIAEKNTACTWKMRLLILPRTD
jgi:hypothetical protein